MLVQTAFSSDELDVFFNPGSTDFLLITFAALDFSTKTDAFWGRHFAEKAGFSAMGFVARRNNWYPQADMAAAAVAIAPLLARYPFRITYGSSMGAYAAVKYSALLGCSACAAFGPQFSIDPADGVTSPAYTRFFDPRLHANMSVRNGDVCAHPYIFFDPWERFDDLNAASIVAVAPQACLVRVPHTGHECIKVVAGSSNATDLLRTCLFGDAGAVRAKSRQLRLKSPARRAGLAGALVGRRPALAQRIVDRSVATFDKKQLATFYDTAAGASLAKGDLESAERNALRAIDLLPQRTSFLRRLALIYDRAHRLDDAHTWYTRYLDLVPDDAAVLNASAGVLLSLNRVAEADAAAQRAFAIAPKNFNVLRRMSAIRVEQGRVADAIALLFDALAVQPQNAQVYLEISKLMSLQHRRAEALESAKTALALDPANKLAKARVSDLDLAE